jgi:hypothetical protein
MTTPSPSASANLLATARAAAASGDILRARRDFRHVVELDPANLEGWLGLAETTSVLRERRGFYERALALDPTCFKAHAGIARIDALLASGVLILPRATPPAPATVEHLPVALPPALEPDLVAAAEQQRSDRLALAAVCLITLATMWLLTTLGIVVFTSFWGFMLAFVAGPAVSELMLRLTARMRRGLSGRPLQIAGGLGMALGGIMALALGGTLLAMVGMPLLPEAVTMARSIGLSSNPTTALLNNPGLLIFISSATVATVHRMSGSPQ